MNIGYSFVILVILATVSTVESTVKIQFDSEDNQESCGKNTPITVNSMEDIRKLLEKKVGQMMIDNPEQTITISSIFAKPDVTCPADWYKASNGYCYHLFGNRFTYDAAKSDCEDEGANLASAGIRDLTVRSELISELFVSEIGDHVWIGLNDKANEKSFVWEDNISYTMNQSDWHNGQPDDKKNEDCVHLWKKSSSWKFKDKVCRGNLKYLCEKIE